MPAKIPVQQFSFTGGQLDGSLKARADLDRYYKGGLELTNFELMSHGGLERRGGLVYCAEVPAAAGGARLAAFEFSTQQAYLHVFTDLNIGVYMDGIHQVDITTTWPAADLDGLDWTQSLDTMLIAHNNYQQRKLVRSGSHILWTLADLALTHIPTYRFGAPTTSTGTPLAITGTAISFTAGGSEFVVGDIGKRIVGNQGKAEITGYTSATVVTVTIEQDFKNTTAIEAGDWTVEENAWSATRGWPGSVALYQGRSYFAGAKELLQSSWGSRSSGDLFNFKDTWEALADEGVAATLEGESVNAVQRVVGLDSLFLFTTGGVFAVTESPVTPAKYIPTKQTAIPAAAIRPVENEDALIYIAADENGQPTTLHELLENPDTTKTKYVAHDLNMLCSDIINAPVDMAARKGRPDATSASHVFIVNGDGTVAVLHSRRLEQVLGWTKLKTPGIARSDKVLRMAVVAGTAYFLIRRTVNSTVRYFIEKLDPDAVFDCSARQDIPITIGAASQANPVVITATGHGLANGDEVRIDDIDVTYDETGALHSGMNELNGRSFKITNVTANTVELQDLAGVNIDGAAYTPYVGGGKMRKKTSTFAVGAHLNGETVKVWADGALRDDATVTAGSITIRDGGEIITAAVIDAGMPFTWVAETMPLEAQLTNGTLIGETHKLVKATVRVRNAHDLNVNGRQQSFRAMRGMTTDAATPGYSGLKTVRFLGWNRKGDPAVTVRMTGQLPITIESVTAVVAQ